MERSDNEPHGVGTTEQGTHPVSINVLSTTDVETNEETDDP